MPRLTEKWKYGFFFSHQDFFSNFHSQWRRHLTARLSPRRRVPMCTFMHNKPKTPLAACARVDERARMPLCVVPTDV